MEQTIGHVAISFGAEELKCWQKVRALGCVLDHRTMTIVLVFPPFPNRLGEIEMVLLAGLNYWRPWDCLGDLRRSAPMFESETTNGNGECLTLHVHQVQAEGQKFLCQV